MSAKRRLGLFAIIAFIESHAEYRRTRAGLRPAAVPAASHARVSIPRQLSTDAACSFAILRLLRFGPLPGMVSAEIGSDRDSKLWRIFAGRRNCETSCGRRKAPATTLFDGFVRMTTSGAPAPKSKTYVLIVGARIDRARDIDSDRAEWRAPADADAIRRLEFVDRSDSDSAGTRYPHRGTAAPRIPIDCQMGNVVSPLSSNSWLPPTCSIANGTPCWLNSVTCGPSEYNS